MPWRLVVPTADIYLVGYGMRLPNDLTLETLAVLKGCKRVFGIPPISAPDFGIPVMENLFQHYGADKSRTRTYGEWRDIVLAAAAADPPVALATYGNAMVGAQVTHRILDAAPAKGLTVHVTNSVSCLDGLWADLNIEPFFGFEVWEATLFAYRKIRPNTRTNLMLPQAPVFGVDTGPDPHTATMATSSTLGELRDHLLEFYPPDHEVHFVRTGSGTGPQAMRPFVDTLRLAALAGADTHAMSTLLVPGLDREDGLDFSRR